jgi:hypothetical protein
MPLLDVFLPSEPIEVLEIATPEAVVELPFIFVVTPELSGLDCAKQTPAVHIPMIKNMIILIFIRSPVLPQRL